MRILITNDDSISSPVLAPLAKWAQKLGEVSVIVPKYEQSGKSHSISSFRFGGTAQCRSRQNHHKSKSH